MKPWTKTAVQGAACGLTIGVVLLIGGRLWQPDVVAAQGEQPAVADVVRARGFAMVDAAGKTRAVLGVLPDGSPGLVLYDAAETPRAALGAHSDGSSGLVLNDAAGKTRAVLSVRPDGRRPGLVLYDAAETPRAALGVSSDGTAVLGLYDGAGKLIWKAP